jgi:hypothetical protein
MADSQKAALVAIFKTHSILNAAKTKEAGRPIYEDMEICEIRTAGDRQSIKVFPAHEVSHHDETADGGSGEPVTYAMRFPEQYKRFKDGTTQSQTGTPLEELPFLTQGKRYELKALNVHTAEALASLDGNPLKQLGLGGRELKNQAQAYLDTADKTANVTKLASENESLRQQIEAMRRDLAKPVEPVEPSQFDAMDDEQLKAFIADKSGSRPRGQPSHATLVRMAEELSQSEAA